MLAKIRWTLTAVSMLGACHAAPALGQLRAELFASGFTSPIAIVQDPADPTAQVVVEQGGRVRALKNRVLRPVDFLDLTADLLLT